MLVRIPGKGQCLVNRGDHSKHYKARKRTECRVNSAGFSGRDSFEGFPDFTVKS